MKNTECPFCGKPLEGGRIIGCQYSMKWLPSPLALFLGIWAFGSTVIGSRFPSLCRPHVKGQRCGACRKIILDY